MWHDAPRRESRRSEPVNQLTDHDVEIQDRIGAKGFLVFYFWDVIGWAKG